MARRIGSTSTPVRSSKRRRHSVDAPLPSSGPKSAASSASSGRRHRHTPQSLDTITSALGVPPPRPSDNEADAQPEREPASAEDAGRQLHFDEEETDSVESEDDDETAEPAVSSGRRQSGANAGAAESSDVESAPPVELPLGAKPRRRTKFWTPEEEECLRKGVEKHGVGKWKLILLDGQGVFSSHRTNIDLKDKWKNLQARTTSEPRGRRQARALAAAPPSGNEEPTAAVEAEAIESSEEDARRPTRPLKKRRVAAELEFVTDATFPEGTSLEVDVRNCADVRTLKTVVRGDMLRDAPADAVVQVVSISSRCLVNDDEAVDACVAKYGRSFYLLY
ncbi:hypothetical protein PybrP1_000054 [[Pythium] brassicae (nom. inval.)]|nr:hypothetical protein PybrP1_000054 [[Pythium] brassicae (nom. inval.)]